MNFASEPKILSLSLSLSFHRLINSPTQTEKKTDQRTKQVKISEWKKEVKEKYYTGTILVLTFTIYVASQLNVICNISNFNLCTYTQEEE